MNTRRIGKEGEQLFYNKLRNYFKVKDVSGDSAYWDKDIDFIVTNPATNQARTFEVKNDTRIAYTGNLYLELTNVHSKDGLGWFKFSQADFLAYCDAHNKVIYIMSMEELRAKIKEVPRRIAYCGTDSSGYLVNFQDLCPVINITVI